jgi:glycine/serine hydroxymethyltransferase
MLTELLRKLRMFLSMSLATGEHLSHTLMIKNLFTWSQTKFKDIKDQVDMMDQMDVVKDQKEHHSKFLMP